MEEMKYREFDVGDEVVVVDEPYMECPFHWVEGMTKLCGRVVTIAEKHYIGNGYNTYGYRIDEDHGDCTWCGNCFLPQEELPDIEDTSFLSAIRMGGGEAS